MFLVLPSAIRSYRPRRKETMVPSTPTTTKPRISKPNGIRLAGLVSSTKVGTASGAAAVNVGRRVAFSVGMNAAAKVGLMVGVEAAVGVGGTSTRGSSCPTLPVSETYRA